jgi:hypothetical protein
MVKGLLKTSNSIVDMLLRPTLLAIALCIAVMARGGGALSIDGAIAGKR